MASRIPYLQLQRFTKTFPIRFLSGGKVYTYESGTTTPKATYSGPDESTELANPVILNENGCANIYLGSGDYTIEIYNSADVLQDTFDNVSGDGSGSGIAGFSVKTIADLRDLAPGIGSTVNVACHTIVTDHGGGIFIWDQTSTASDDDGINIIPNSTPSSGRWVRMYVGNILPQWFGVIANGTTDDLAAMNLAILGAVNKVLEIPRGLYKLSAGITFPSTVSIIMNELAIFSGTGITLTFNGLFSAFADLKFPSGVTPSFPTIYVKEFRAAWFNTINQAVTAIGSSNRCQLVVNETTFLTSNLTITANIGLKVNDGGLLSAFSGSYTASIAGPITAGQYQIFNTNITVTTTKIISVLPEWFGALGTGTNDDAAAFNASVACLINGGLIQCDAPSYLIGSNVVVGVNHVSGYGIMVNGRGCGTLPGAGQAATTFLKKAGMSTPVFTLGGLKDGLSNLSIDDQNCYNNNNHVPGSTGVGVLVLCGRSRLEDVAVFNMASDGIRYGDDTVHYNLNSWYAKNIATKYNGGTGFNMKGEFDGNSPTSAPDCNAGRLDGLDSQFNGVYGIYTQQASSNIFAGIQCEFNTSHGLHVGQGSANNVFIGGDLNEANADLTDHYNVYVEDNIYDQICYNMFYGFTCNENLLHLGSGSTCQVDIPQIQGNTVYGMPNVFRRSVAGSLDIFTGYREGVPDAGEQLGLHALTTVTNKPARCASQSNITLSNPGTAVFDGVTAGVGDKILVMSQSSAIQNGLYKFNGSAVAMTRSTDMAAGTSAVGKVVYVVSGTLSGGKSYETVGTPIVVGTDAMVWQLATTGTYASLSMYQDNAYMGGFYKHPDGDIRIDDSFGIRIRLQQGSAMILDGNGLIQLTDADNIGTGTGTGTIIAESASQKLGFHGIAATIQSVADTDPRAVLAAKGLSASQVQVQTTPGCMFTSSSSVTVVSTTAETTILGGGVGSLTIKANKLVAGKTVRVEGYGFFSTTATPTFNLRFKIGGTEFCSTGAVSPSGTGAGFAFKLDFTCFHTGVSGDGYAYGTVTMNGTIYHMIGSLTTVDTTIDNAINLTAKWSASSASNSVRTNITTIELLN